MDGRRTAVRAIARTASIIFSGLFAGFLVGVLVLELSLRDFSGSTYAHVREVELVGLDRLATATLLPALVATLCVVLVSLRQPGLSRSLVPLLLLVAVFVLSLTVNVPINQDQLDWNVDAPPADWADERDRWQIAHAARTVAAALAFALLSVPERSRASTTSWRCTPKQAGGVAMRPPPEDWAD
jgi:uncharacterized membrane protein